MSRNASTSLNEDKNQKAPSRTIGFTLMVLIIVFVAVWMQAQGNNLENSPASQPYEVDIDGFKADAWFLPDDLTWGFVEVSAGEFVMGSNPALDRSAYENERWSNLERQGEVFLPTYFIGRFETTVAQFAAYAREVGLEWDQMDGKSAPQLPIHNITWADALGYGRWLDSKLRSSLETPKVIKSFLENGGRITIPSEAEWEKAARGTDGRIFPWGSRPSPDFANFNSSEILPVGEMRCEPCANGLSDMSGNVWEFTRSPLQDYPYNPSDDESNLSEDALWVMRGGSYAESLNNIRAAVRGAVDPGVRSGAIGFRVVVTSL